MRLLLGSSHLTSTMLPYLGPWAPTHGCSVQASEGCTSHPNYEACPPCSSQAPPRTPTLCLVLGFGGSNGHVRMAIFTSWSCLGICGWAPREPGRHQQQVWHLRGQRQGGRGKQVEAGRQRQAGRGKAVALGACVQARRRRMLQVPVLTPSPLSPPPTLQLAGDPPSPSNRPMQGQCLPRHL